MAEAKSKSSAAALFVGIVVIAAIGIAILATVLSKSPTMEMPVYGTKTSAEGATYVGSRECAECHQEKHAGWLSTLHPYKVQEASHETIVGDFWKNNTFEHSDGVTITMKEVNDRFFMNTVNQDGQYQDFEIIYTLGGEWKQRYMTVMADGAIHPLPIQFNIATQAWGNWNNAAPDARNFWMKRHRIFQTGCGDCHVTGMDIGYDERTDTFNTTWVDSGIACESCHGPGSNHIEAAPGYEIQTIVNPARLAHRDAQSAICGRCHNRGESTALVADHYNIRDGARKFGYPYGFKVGRTVEPYFDSVSPETDTPRRFWPSAHMSSHRQQYLEWKESFHRLAGLSCLDCHKGLHGESGTRRLIKAEGNKLCLSCHNEPEKSNTGIHAVHASGSCVECHMPRTGRTAVRLTKYGGDLRTHLDTFLYPQATIDAGGLDKQLNACNTCHYHENDKPEDLQRVINKLRDERRKTFGMQ